ncbi:MAG: GNAT family N-acetyltransferase [Saprospiraceae bacterium]|nr:GNAT family N-acetyltransferase [Saprospiraceae bacterium]
MKKYQKFETERLFIRPTTEEDAAFLLELMNSPKWLKFIGDRKVHSIRDALQYIRAKMLPQLRHLGFSNYTILLKSNQQKIGTCGLFDREGLEGIDIGFALLPDFEKQGYAFEAASIMRDSAFELFGVRFLSAITTDDNHSSQKLITALGLVFDRHISIPNDEAELRLYTMNIDQYKNLISTTNH